MSPHLAEHGSNNHGDSLDLLVDEDQVLRELFAEWDRKEPDSGTSGEKVLAGWDRGTAGKLLLEHAAVRLAAKHDVARVLRRNGQARMADAITKNDDDARGTLGRVDRLSRGVQAISLAKDPAFIEAVEQLRGFLRGQLQSEPEYVGDRVAQALGPHRRELKSARYIAKHALTDPGPARWYRRVPFILRFEAAWQRLRGFPWAESPGMANTDLAERFNADE